MHRTTAMTILALALLGARSAMAAPEATAPAGGGQPALTVRVDLAAHALEANGVLVPVPVAQEQLPPEGDVRVHVVPIGAGRSVVHVQIPLRGGSPGVAWEAVLAGSRREPLFAGFTGRMEGDPGERVGRRLDIIENGATSFVLLGDVREDVDLCGRGLPLLEPRALYPSSLDWRPATVQRLSAEAQAEAEAVAATPADPGSHAPLAQLLAAHASSVPGSLGSELTDGDPSTYFVERRPGAGQGEFVVMSAPADVPIARLRVTVGAPEQDAPNRTAPKSFYLVTGRDIFAVTLPTGAGLKPGGAFDIALPHPVKTSCLALVLDAADARGRAHPDVSVAELQAYSEFDGPAATLDDVAGQLSGERGAAAAEVLERAAGGDALAAVERAFDRLDDRGRARAMDVAAAQEECVAAAPLLVRGLCSAGETATKAREKLERCSGASSALAATLRDHASTRSCVAPVLAELAPAQALEPIADALAATPVADSATRDALRSALSSAIAGSAPAALGTLLGDGHRSATARLEFLRAAKGKLAEAPAESESAIEASSAGQPDLRTRYLLLDPLEELAQHGDRSAAGRISKALASDPDWPVRARAARAAARLAIAQPALVGAAHDAAPRVRAAAFESLAEAGADESPAAIAAAEQALANDGWSFVRGQAVGVLARAPAGAGVDASLARALGDHAVAVRGSALVALARHGAREHSEEIRARLDDKDEDADVRAAAARALGAVCDADSVDHLTDLARKLGASGASDDDQQIALASVQALAALKPADLRARLAPLAASSSRPYARAAAERALEARGTCTPAPR